MKSIKKVVHLSDVHIQILQRHKEYREVFNRLHKSLLKKDVDLIVICGDLFHSRTNLSPEAIDLAWEFFSLLTEISDVIVIAGNHDAVLTANQNRMDAIEPVVKQFNENRPKDKNKVLYYQKSGVYAYENIDFGVYSVLDYLNPKKSEFRDDSIKIGLYHGMLKGASLDSGRTVERDGRELDFGIFDRIMLGDIHKLQKIKDNAYYSGSLVQRRFLEDPKKHGYLYHDLEKLDEDPTLIKIKNDYGFYYLNFDGMKFSGDYTDIPSKAYVKVRYPKEIDKKEVRREFEDKFSHVEKVDFDVIVEEGKDRNIDIKDDINQLFSLENLNSLISQYYDGDEEEELREKMISCNKDIYNEVADQINDTFVSGDYEINSMEFDNVFAYGEGNIVDFKNLGGITGLFSSNRSGKTSFLNTIVVAIYGNAEIVDVQEEFINTQADGFRTKIELEKNGDIYTIERIGKRKSGGGVDNKVVFNKNGEPEGGTINETNKLIEQTFGEYKTFYKLFYISQTSPEMFLDLKPMQRKEWIYKNLGVDIFEILHRYAKVKYNDLVSKVDDLKDIDFEQEFSLLKIEIMENEKDYKKKTKEKKEISKDLKRLEKEQNKIQLVELEDDFKKKFDSAKNKVQDIKNSIEDQKNILENRKKQLKNIDTHEAIVSIEKEIEEEKSKFENVQSKIESDEKSDRQVELEDKREKVLKEGSKKFEKKNELKKKINSNVPEKKEIDNEVYSALLDTKSDLKDKLISTEIKKEQEDDRLEKLKNNISVLKEDERFENEELCQTCPLLKNAFDEKELIPDVKNNIKDKEKEIEEIKSKLSFVEEKIQQAEKSNLEWEKYYESVKDLQKTMDDVKSLLEKKEDIEEQIEYEKERYKKELSDKKDRISDNIDSLKEKLSDKKEYLEKSLKTGIETGKDQIKSNEKLLVSAEEKVEQYKDKLKLYEENEEKEKQIDEYDLLINNQNVKLTEVEDTIEKINVEKGKIETKISTLKEQEEKFKQYKEDIDLYGEYSKITHKDELPLLFVSNILNLFQAEINEVISQIDEFTVKLEIEDNNINSYLLENGQQWSTNLCSGMERFIINIAFRIAISKIGNIVTPNFIIVDEGFNALDK